MTMDNKTHDLKKTDAGTNNTVKSRFGGRAAEFIIALVASALGALFVFYPPMDTRVVCYAFCIILIVIGIVSLVLFFMAERYKRLEDYHFATGTVLFIFGICSLISVDHMSSELEFYLGLTALILATLILQSTVQLCLVGNKLFIVALVSAIFTIVGVVPILCGLDIITSHIDGYVYWILMIAGILDMISMILTWIGLRNKDAATGEDKAPAMDEDKKDAPYEEPAKSQDSPDTKASDNDNEPTDEQNT